MYGFIKTILSALIISIITSYLTVKFSMNQFFSQRMWEKKADAYSCIIEHLSYLQYYFGEWDDEVLGIKKLEDKDRKRLYKGYSQAKESITKAAATGAYIVSEDTASALEKFLCELEKEGPMPDFDRCYASVKNCIIKIREYAKTDLS